MLVLGGCKHTARNNSNSLLEGRHELMLAVGAILCRSTFGFG